LSTLFERINAFNERGISLFKNLRDIMKSKAEENNSQNEQ
jgi:hypothetical protein